MGELLHVHQPTKRARDLDNVSPELGLVPSVGLEVARHFAVKYESGF